MCIRDSAWIEKLRELERPGADNILAFYEHRFGAICRDPRLMLAPLDDHLVHRGDGVFETIRFTERKVIHLDAHRRRLANSAAGLSLTPVSYTHLDVYKRQVRRGRGHPFAGQ